MEFCFNLKRGPAVLLLLLNLAFQKKLSHSLATKLKITRGRNSKIQQLILMHIPIIGIMILCKYVLYLG